MFAQGINLVQQYLQCYSSLSDPKKSKQANRRLIQIEASPQAWAIAQTLIKDQQQTHQVHGCQLLSKKLNTPLPPSVVPNSIADFIYSQTNKTKLHWLCIAKCLLHMNSKSAIPLQFFSSDRQRLLLLRQMSSAIVQTHTNQLIDIKNLLRSYYNANKQLLLINFDSHSGQVIDVLNSFLENGAKLDSVPLLQKILECQLEDIQILLEAVLRYETYPSLIQSITAYLLKVQEYQQAFSIHLAFYRNSWKYFSNQQFQYMISYVLKHLQSNQQHFSQSYEFWHDLMIQQQEGHLNASQLAQFQNAVVSLWRLICIRCLLTQLPQHKKASQSSLYIDLDAPQEQNHLQQGLNCNQSAQHFRDLAGDFLSVCLKTFGLESPFIAHMNNNLQGLANNSLLQLQLAIYIISTICEVMPVASKQSKDAVVAILRRENVLNEYLCGRVIDLIAKLANLFQSSPDLLPPCLAFLSKCLTFDSLAPIASQSCCEMLQSSQVYPSSTVSEDLQEFLGHLYELFFSQAHAERTRNNLAKAMTIFIYKFKNTSSQYLVYLTNYSHKIEQMDPQTRAKFIDSAISAHFWMNVHDQGKNQAAFEWFLNEQAAFLLQNIQASQNKNQLTEAVNLLNLAFKTNAVSYIDTWVHVVNQTLTRFIQIDTPLSIAMTPLINLAKAALHLQNHQITEKVAQLLQYWSSNVIVLLGDISAPKFEFNISNMVVQVHLVLLQIYYTRKDLLQRQKYSGNGLLVFILNLFNKTEIWQYELYKNCLAYLTLAVKLGSPPQSILTTLFRNYKKFADTLWKSVESLLLQSFKQSGSPPILNALQEIQSPLNSSNPLTAVLVTSLHEGQLKTTKNILLCLS